MDTLQNTHQAMAALASGSMPAPVAFSPSTFLYPFSLLMTAIGTQRLMPTSDVDSVVINVKSGYARRNRSFILSRLLRDWPLERKAGDMMHGLYVTIVDAVKAPQKGQASLDTLTLLSWLTIATQFLIAIHSRTYFTLATFLLGTLISTLLPTLPQWTTEKFACRKNNKQTYALTTGNGASHVLLIRGNGLGYNLEDMASARAPWDPYTRIYLELSCVFSVLMMWHLVLSVQLEKGGHMLAILFLGLVQNVIAAGVPRGAAEMGFGLDVEGAKTLWGEKVRDALVLAEGEVEGAGEALVPVFFPGGLKDGDGKLIEVVRGRKEKESV